jgi:hypothetical protein
MAYRLPPVLAESYGRHVDVQGLLVCVYTLLYGLTMTHDLYRSTKMICG